MDNLIEQFFRELEDYVDARINMRSGKEDSGGYEYTQYMESRDKMKTLLEQLLKKRTS